MVGGVTEGHRQTVHAPGGAASAHPIAPRIIEDAVGANTADDPGQSTERTTRVLCAGLRFQIVGVRLQLVGSLSVRLELALQVTDSSDLPTSSIPLTVRLARAS